jgi:delta-aminolevulinic acid dehydratase/porphobilinogen synthase
MQVLQLFVLLAFLVSQLSMAFFLPRISLCKNLHSVVFLRYAYKHTTCIYEPMRNVIITTSEQRKKLIKEAAARREKVKDWILAIGA